MMPRFHKRRAIALMIVAFLLQPIPFLSSAEDATSGYADAIPAESSTSPNIIFTDIQGHWAEPAIQKAVAAGIVKGYGDGTFRPDQPITNAEFRLMLHRIAISAISAGLKWPSGTGGYDSPSETTGTPGTGTAANLDAPITRQEAATLLLTLPLPNVPGGQAEPVGVPSFPDWSDVAVWARDAMATMIVIGYLTGHDDGYLRPDGILSRAEGATLLIRVIEGVATIQGAETGSSVVNHLTSSRGGGSTGSVSHSTFPISPPGPNPQSSNPTSSHIRHLGNWILLKTDSTGKITTFEMEDQSAQGVTDSDALISSFWVSSTSSGLAAEGIDYENYAGQVITAKPDAMVYEAVLSTTGTFESYRQSDQSEISIGDRVYLYNSDAATAIGKIANLIIYHRGLNTNYGIVLAYINEMTVEGAQYPARVKLKTSTGETRNFAFASSSAVTGVDVTSEDALSVYQLISYEIDEDGRISQVKSIAERAASGYTSLEFSSTDLMLAKEIGPFSNTLIDIAITISSIAVVVVFDEDSISVVDMEEIASDPAISLPVADTAFLREDGVLQAMLLQSDWDGSEWIFGSDKKPFAIDQAAGIMTIGGVQYAGLNPVTVTVASINANSTVITGYDGKDYVMNADAIVYIPSGEGEYEAENLFYVMPRDVLTLYYIQHNTDSTSGPYNIAVQ